MMRTRWICAGVALLVTAGAAEAQTGRLSLEGRGGVALPTGQLSDGGASSGFSAAVDLMYNMRPWLTAFGGVSRDEFDGGFSSSGMQAGAKLLFPHESSVLPWAAAGFLMQEMNSGSAESGLEPGFEGGAGADIALTPRFSLTPAVRYRAYDAGILPGEIEARYFVVTLGAHLHLR
jgi:hypothetical protein